MKLKVASPNQPLSPPDNASDIEEKEVSEEDDDDRNHKHRRREARSQSDRDTPEPLFSRPYRKRNKAYENGNFHQDGDSQSSGTWRNYHLNSHEKDLSGNLNKRRPSLSSYPRAPFESTRNFSASLPIGEFGPGRGRGREPAFWGQRDSRFGSAEGAPMLSSLFAGRGIPAYGQSPSWSPFGMVPVLPNGGIDALHPLHLQGPIRQSISPGMNLGIPRQQCRDFEERGFCLRGDMCPMEHGVNRIVVEDVQSLTQFNLPSTHILGTPASQGASPGVNVHNATRNKGGGTKTGKLGANVDSVNLSGGEAPATIGADLYDPDQPLWANDDSETSAALKSINPSGMDETMSLLDMEPSGGRHLEFSYGVDSERPVKSMGAMAQLKGKSVWGRIGSSKHNMEGIDSGGDLVENIESLANSHGAGSHERPANTSDTAQQVVESSHRSKLDSGRNVRKPSQKALRTLFVNGIPHKDNTKAALLSHFRKFGQVIDIHIPPNSERAFVQFSKREEAEATLRAPDAVMGNRFIKLWWANRDSIPDNGISGSSFVPVTGTGVSVPPVVSHASLSGMDKDNPHSIVHKINASDSSYTVGSGQSLPVATTGLKAPPQQKKLESLELLKEEIRKKQEMLDQKRNEFRLQLDRLQKQASGVRQEHATEPCGASPKLGKSDKLVKSKSAKYSGLVTQPLENVDKADSSKSNLENTTSEDHQLSKPAVIQASMSPKPSFRPLAPPGAPFISKRFKLDNRPTSFMVMPPLPSSLENVSALKEHFSGFGDLVSAELERLEPDGMHDSETSKAARICFTTRRAAEKAFSDGKYFEGHTLQFMWPTLSSSSCKDTRDNEKPSDPEQLVNADDVQPAPETAYINSNKDDDSPKEEDKSANDICLGLDGSNGVPGNLDPNPKDLRSSSAS